jgi:dTDP-4-dehydrorhamnose 3,5-epimerase
VCNGFQATSEGGCEYLYCFGTEWAPDMAGVAVTPLDPALGIDWPLPADPLDPSAVSAKDAAAPQFADLP